MNAVNFFTAPAKPTVFAWYLATGVVRQSYHSRYLVPTLNQRFANFRNTEWFRPIMLAYNKDFHKRAAPEASMGVKINDVRIQNITVPKDVASAYEDVNNAKNEKTKRLDESEKYKNEILPKARSNAYETVKQAEAYKAETVAQAESDTAVFKAVYKEYQAAPEITRRKLLIETLEKVLKNSGRIVIADTNSDVVKVLDLNTLQSTNTSTAAVLEGGDAK